MDVECAELPILRHLQMRIAIHPPTLEVIVEASPDDAPDAWRDLFNRMQAASSTAWAIENDYELK